MRRQTQRHHPPSLQQHQNWSEARTLQVNSRWGRGRWPREAICTLGRRPLRGVLVHHSRGHVWVMLALVSVQRVSISPCALLFPKWTGLLFLSGKPSGGTSWMGWVLLNCLPLPPCRVPFVLLQQWSGDDFLPRAGEQPQQRSLGCLCVRHCHCRSQRGYPGQREVPQNVVGRPRWEKRKGPLGRVVPPFLGPHRPPFQGVLEELLPAGGSQAMAGAIFQRRVRAGQHLPTKLQAPCRSCLGPIVPDSWMGFQADSLSCPAGFPSDQRNSDKEFVIRRAATNRVLNVLRHWVSKHAQVQLGWRGSPQSPGLKGAVLAWPAGLIVACGKSLFDRTLKPTRNSSIK